MVIRLILCAYPWHILMLYVPSLSSQGDMGTQKEGGTSRTKDLLLSWILFKFSVSNLTLNLSIFCVLSSEMFCALFETQNSAGNHKGNKGRKVYWNLKGRTREQTYRRVGGFGGHELHISDLQTPLFAKLTSKPNISSSNPTLAAPNPTPLASNPK